MRPISTLQRQAREDPLTGLLNRRGMELEMRRELEGERAHNHELHAEIQRLGETLGTVGAGFERVEGGELDAIVGGDAVDYQVFDSSRLKRQ